VSQNTRVSPNEMVTIGVSAIMSSVLSWCGPM